MPKSVPSVIGNGGYDTTRCSAAISSMGATELIPPRKTGKHRENLDRRNQAISEIKGLGRDLLAREI